MGPTKREQLIEDLEGIGNWQVILETKRDFHIREVLLFILKILKDFLEYKAL